jgi:hypothetical protein
MGDRDRQSVKDRSKDGKILSTVDRDHGGLSLLAVQGREDIQKRVRGLLGTIDVSSNSRTLVVQDLPISTVPYNNVIFSLALQVGEPCLLDVSSGLAEFTDVEDSVGIKRLLGIDGSGQDIVRRLEQVRLKSEKFVAFRQGSRRQGSSSGFGKRSSLPVGRRWR